MHHQRCFHDTQTRASQPLGHGDAQPAAVCHRCMKFIWIGLGLLALRPIFVIEVGAYLAHILDDGALRFVQVEIHSRILHSSFVDSYSDICHLLGGDSKGQNNFPRLVISSRLKGAGPDCRYDRDLRSIRRCWLLSRATLDRRHVSHRGARFSANARGPSCASWLVFQRANSG